MYTAKHLQSQKKKNAKKLRVLTTSNLKGIGAGSSTIRHGPKASLNFTLEGDLLPGAGFKPMTPHGH